MRNRTIELERNLMLNNKKKNKLDALITYLIGKGISKRWVMKTEYVDEIYRGSNIRS